MGVLFPNKKKKASLSITDSKIYKKAFFDVKYQN